jgi:hypothetical protein
MIIDIEFDDRCKTLVNAPARKCLEMIGYHRNSKSKIHLFKIQNIIQNITAKFNYSVLSSPGLRIRGRHFNGNGGSYNNIAVKIIDPWEDMRKGVNATTNGEERIMRMDSALLVRFVLTSIFNVNAEYSNQKLTSAFPTIAS